MTQITVTKRNGSREKLDYEKIHKVVYWATAGLSGVSVSDLEIKSHIQFYNGIKTEAIQETLIKSAADLISEESPNYQFVAGRLINYHLRKKVYGDYAPWHLHALLKFNTDLGLYDPVLISAYTTEEWNQIDSFIDHDRDLTLTYVAMEQLRGKYLVQNRVVKEIFETPQMAYILIAASLFQKYPKETRLTWVKDYYDAISKHDISLPTPVMAGVRTNQKQFSSCVLIETADSLDSINATASSIVKYVSQKAGIGLGIGSIRGLGSAIRKGDAYHTGLIPFIKYFQSAVKSCCLDKETLVEILTDSGTHTIKLSELQVGVFIKTYENGCNTFKKVVNVWSTEVKQEDRLTLEFTNGTTLHCSINHPIMVLTGNGVEQRLPRQLLVSDQVITENGVCNLTVLSDDTRDIDYIDIEVEGTHTFFAKSKLDQQMVLTHNSQGSVRSGSATLYWPIWHYEAKELLVLKNNKGTEENRVRHVDYGVQFNKLMYERLLSNGNITLFSPHDVPGLYKAFFADQDKFRELYERAERNTHIRKQTVPATELFTSFMQERKDTGRIYLQNVDHNNTHSPFNEKVAPVRMSNLCAEIALPTVPLNDINDGATKKRIRVPKDKFIAFLEYKKKHGGFLFGDALKNPLTQQWLYEVVTGTEIEDTGNFVYLDEYVRDENGAAISLCTLSAVNWGNVKAPKDFERICTLAVRGLDALLDYQDYPIIAAKMSTEEFRTLGVGIINFAYFLAKHNVKYSDPAALTLVDEYAEAWSYYLIKASADLAVEQGPCTRWQDTKYVNGILPIDTRKREVDELVPHIERMPWQELREQVKVTGVRNATVMAAMPSECQSLNNNMLLKDGSSISLEELIQERGNIDISSAHDAAMVGQRFPFLKPVELANSTAYECYYNGPQEMTEIEFEDGSKYKFTENHKLLVERNGKSEWVMVRDLMENDEINGFGI